MNEKIEERQIEIYGAKISVYSDGSVWNQRGSRNCRRFGDTTDKGYKVILLRDNGKKRTVFVHKLVAMAFVPNPENKPQINHKNGNKADNRPENLEWCTNMENQRHRHEVLHHHGRRRPVMCVDTGKTYETTKSASEDTKTNRGNIIRSANSNHLKAGGYKWEWGR